MHKRLRILLFLGLLTSLIGLGACASSSAPVPGDGGGEGTIPATPPAPPAELPSFLRFPESLSIDSSSLSSSGEELQTLLAQVGEDFSFFIALGPIVVDINLQAVEVLIRIFDEVDIPVSPQVKSFEGKTKSPEDHLKFDFADFDNQGCSGCTCPVGCDLAECPTQAAVEELKPVCYRIWRDPDGDGNFERFVAGRFDRLAIRDDPNTETDESERGSGQFRAREQGSGFVNLLTEIAGSYDFVDPADIISTVFVRLNEELSAHTELTQRGPTEHEAIKTIKFTEDLSSSEMPQQEFIKYIGRFRDAHPFWSGSVDSTVEFDEPDDIVPGVTGPIPPTTFEAVCASTATGLGVPQANCIDLGIDVTGEEFLRFLQLDDIFLPDESVFPLTPPQSKG